MFGLHPKVAVFDAIQPIFDRLDFLDLSAFVMRGMDEDCNESEDDDNQSKDNEQADAPWRGGFFVFHNARF